MNDVYGFVKPRTDVHTLGMNGAVKLLNACGCYTLVAASDLEEIVDLYLYKKHQPVFLEWLSKNEITYLGISYRLDCTLGYTIISRVIEDLIENEMLSNQNGLVKKIFVGGLPDLCTNIKNKYGLMVEVFIGGEIDEDSLIKMGVTSRIIESSISETNSYDKFLVNFGKKIVSSREYLHYQIPKKFNEYKEFGTNFDNLKLRLSNRISYEKPLIRAHMGPYFSNLSREENISEFILWINRLTKTNYLDVLSIGSSQLTQSAFGENWDGMSNGGGAPINSSDEYKTIKKAAQSMLVRTYSGTKKIDELAIIHEESLNMSWHAFSLWWFNQLDRRGGNTLKQGLKEQINAIKYVIKIDKPIEANVSHHFSFRGGDDITYIVSAFIAAKLVKLLGGKTFILQNMLNMPRETKGIFDIAKARALLKVIKELENDDFAILYQPRVGLDFLKSDSEYAKAQIVFMTALMDDVEPYVLSSPDIIHVVSYSEGVELASPEVIDESIKLTLYSLEEYRKIKKMNNSEIGKYEDKIKEREEQLYNESKYLINCIENTVVDTYSAEGLYNIFVSGFLHVPDLWNDSEEFFNAKNWKTKMNDYGINVVDDKDNCISIELIANICVNNYKNIKRTV